LKSVDIHDSTKLPLDQQQHAMLLSRNYEQNAPTQYLNKALKKGYLTIYLPINGLATNKSSASHLSKIVLPESIEYEENMSPGNILTFDTKTFYNFALAGDLQPFEELKVLIEEAIEEKRIASKRNDEELIVVVVAEVAAELNRNEKFDECITVEKWWQRTHSEWLQKGLKVTVICPHLIPELDKSEFMHYKQAISSLHDIIVDSRSEGL
jgi:hypothetical protein